MQTWPNWKQFNRCVFARHTLNNKFICHFAQNLHKGIAKKKIAMNTSIVSDPSSKNCLNLPWILFLLRLHNVVIFHFFFFSLGRHNIEIISYVWYEIQNTFCDRWEIFYVNLYVIEIIMIIIHYFIAKEKTMKKSEMYV